MRQCNSAKGLLFPGDLFTFRREGFTLRARIEAYDDGTSPEGSVGVVVEVVEHVEVRYPTGRGSYIYKHDVVLGDASLWGIDSLEDGYGEDVVEQLAPEALSHARGVLKFLKGLKPPREGASVGSASR